MKTAVALGIDIGGTNTKFGFIDRAGNYLAEGNILTATHENIKEGTMCSNAHPFQHY